MASRTLEIPHNYSPRSYQEKFWKAMAGPKGLSRAVLVWHRRSGKDKTALNFCITKMLERVGTYFYLLPTYAQAKKIIWDGKDSQGFGFLDHFPQEIIKKGPQGHLMKNETELQVTLANNSIFQLIGTDQIDRIVGTNPVGVVFSEFSLQDKKAYDLLRPILRENGGWAVFIYTPRGKNHGHDLYEMAKKNKDWYTSILTVEDTRRDSLGEDGRRTVSDRDVEADRREGMSEALIMQEYYCSFAGALEGAYFGDQITKAREGGRVGEVPWNPNFPVHTAWDLGLNDATAIWFVQKVGAAVHVIDYFEDNNEPIGYYAQILKQKPYTYGTHYGPHDLKRRSFQTLKTVWQAAASHGLYFQVVPKLTVRDGVEAVRRLIPQCYFDEKQCARGIDGLVTYRREYDEFNRIYRANPVKDWSNHPADAFRYLAIGLNTNMEVTRPATAEMDFDIFSYDQDQPQRIAVPGMVCPDETPVTIETEFNPLRHH